MCSTPSATRSTRSSSAPSTRRRRCSSGWLCQGITAGRPGAASTSTPDTRVLPCDDEQLLLQPRPAQEPFADEVVDPGGEELAQRAAPALDDRRLEPHVCEVVQRLP